MSRLAQLEAEVLLIRNQLSADRESLKTHLSRVLEIETEITQIRDEERQARENRGLYGRLASVATLQREFPEINVRSLVTHAATNGLEDALIRPHGENHNGRVLIDRERLNLWLEGKRCITTMKATEPPNRPPIPR